MALITLVPSGFYGGLGNANATSKAHRGRFFQTQRRNPTIGIQDDLGIGTIGVPKAKNLQRMLLLPCVRERHLRRKLPTLKFSSTDPQESSGGLKPESEITGATQSSIDGRSPPFLTIVAGLVVFLLFAWAVLSILMWVVSLFHR
eukprot:Gb_13709 [translate_table: standard]